MARGPRTPEQRQPTSEVDAALDAEIGYVERGTAASDETSVPSPISIPSVQATTRMRLPKALQPAPLGTATIAKKLVVMTASVISKPTQSLIAARTGLRIGPAQPVRVRIVR
jgi:hypothetical protein